MVPQPLDAAAENLELRTVRDRADRRRLVQGVAHDEGRQPVGQALQQWREQVTLHQDLPRPLAPLTVELRHAVDDAVGGHLEVGVIQDEDRVVAAELELQHLEVLGARASNGATGLYRSVS